MVEVAEAMTLQRSAVSASHNGRIRNMLSYLMEMWNAVLGIMIFIGLCGVFCAAMQQLKWKYEPGA
jgi:hypothetical protein